MKKFQEVIPDEEHWCKYGYSNVLPNGSRQFCLSGAVLVLSATPNWSLNWHNKHLYPIALSKAFEQITGRDAICVPSFNDSPSTTFQDIQPILARADELLLEMEHGI